MGNQDAGDAQERAPEIVVVPDAWERRWHFVYARIRPRVPTREDAQDLTQEAMVRTDRGLPPDVGSEKAWLARVADNLVADFYRYSGRRPVTQGTLEWTEDAGDEERRYLDAIERRQSAVFEVPSEQLVEDIWDGVTEILDDTTDPAGNLEIVQLIAQGYAYAEIAAKLGVAETRVRNMLSRMRQKLAERHPEWAADRRLRGPRRRAPDDGAQGQETERDTDTGEPPDTPGG